MRAEEQLLSLSQNPELRCKYYIGSVRWEHAACKECQFFPNSREFANSRGQYSTETEKPSPVPNIPYPHPQPLFWGQPLPVTWKVSCERLVSGVQKRGGMFYELPCCWLNWGLGASVSPQRLRSKGPCGRRRQVFLAGRWDRFPDLHWLPG